MTRLRSRLPVVLSLEQALSMSYATLRMVHLGWRVIRLEATPIPGLASKGDPNRYIGRPFGGEDRHSYYVAPNVGKEAIALNLKTADGREALRRIVSGLGVDVFCTNTLPARHEALGVDYDGLRSVRDDLVWCCISAMGPEHPDVPGYDPVMQAMMGYMDLTGEADGPPMQCGLPFTDLKAGDEAFTQVALALWERERSGRGRRIDVSMAASAASWLHTFLPMLDMGSTPGEMARRGNEHRQFIPVNAYRTADGFIYLAIGSDSQWRRFANLPIFAALCQGRFETNEGRRGSRVDLHAGIEAITSRHPTAVVASALSTAGIPNSPIHTIEQVQRLPVVADAALHTTSPDGRTVRLPPPAVSTEHLEEIGGELPFAPAYGEHTDAILAEAGVGPDEIATLRAHAIVA